MPVTLAPQLRTALGLCVKLRGNIGGVTFRRDLKRGTMSYRERRRLAPLTDKQLAHQVKFKRAYEQWSTLTDEQQAAWNRAADVASTRKIGSHLFLRVWWYQDTWTLEQFARWYNITLFLPGP